MNDTPQRPNLTVAIASGKGGTGKTTVAVNLAAVAAARGLDVLLADCDVEEPNAHIFVKPRIAQTIPVTMARPHLDPALCTGCGECAPACHFNAIAAINTNVTIFPELCHGCGACWLICPTKAITETTRNVGTIELGPALAAGPGPARAPQNTPHPPHPPHTSYPSYTSYSSPPSPPSPHPVPADTAPFRFIHGRVNVGEAAASPPVIARVKAHVTGCDLAILDAPPGTTCPMVATVKDADFACLVTEPTPFGLHDLTLAVDTVRQIGLQFGVVINRANLGDSRVRDYCRRERIPLLAEIPHDRRIAHAYSRGELICSALPEFRPAFDAILTAIQEAAAR